MPLAALGGRDRTRRQPWISVVAAIKAAVEAIAASWYFYQMPAKEKAWCGYCVAGALANIGIMALPLPEASKSLQTLRRGRGRSPSLS